MRLTTLFSTPLLLTAFAGISQAQNLHFNEIYGSMAGSDFSEFIELIGTPGMSLDGFVVCIVEGQGGGQGTLDRVWDLTGYTMPTDGFFVMGNIATVANTDYDLAQGPHGGLGVQDNIENGTETFYLLQVPNPLDIDDLENTLYNTDIDGNADLVTIFTEIPTSFTVLENLCILLVANDPHDVAHDCAVEIGPDGTFFPAGIFRPGDYPSPWCGDGWLDFSNPGGPDQTPGAANQTTACGVSVTDGPGCGGSTTLITVPFCSPMDNNSTGFPTILTGTSSGAALSGLHLEATQGPPTQFGYFLMGTALSDPGLVVSQGRLCLSVTGGNAFGRYNVPGSNMNSVGQFNASGVMQNVVGTSSTGSGFDVPDTLPLAGLPTIVAGSTWHFQLWHRENGGLSNFSNGLSVTF